MFSLKEIQNNIESNNKYKHETPKINIGNSIPILTKIIKKQNLDFLKSIAKIKNLSNIETNDLIEKYHKLNYYCPIIKN